MITYKTTVSMVIEDVKEVTIANAEPLDAPNERVITVFTRQGDRFELTLRSDRPITMEDDWLIPKVYKGKPVADEEVAP